MGNVNSSSMRTDISTNILQKANNVCSDTANNNISNTTIIAAGNIDIDQTIKANFACALANTFDATITNTITDSIKQTATTENGVILPSVGSDSNYSSMNENIRNNISQILNNTCTITKGNNISGDFIVSKTGSVNITQDIINTNGGLDTCNIQNTVSASAANAVSNTAEQTASITNALTSIVTVLAICGMLTAVGTQAFKKQAGFSKGDIVDILGGKK